MITVDLEKHTVVPPEEDGTTGTAESVLTEEEERQLRAAEKLCDELEELLKEPVWQRVPNRRMRRDLLHLRGEIQHTRSRIRRGINRVRRQKGAWK